MTTPHRKKNSLHVMLIITIVYSIPSKPQDIIHFYRATPIFPEPRFEQNWLFSTDVSISGGFTKRARNSNKEKVALLDIYGCQELLSMGINLPAPKNPTIHQLINEFNQLSNNGIRQYLSLGGQFNILELYGTITANFTHGLFLQTIIPIRTLSLKPTITESCIMPPVAPYPISCYEWLHTLLNAYNINLTPYKRTGLGDLYCGIGWTINYQETQELDFIDFSVKTGILLPTGLKKNPYAIFSLPHGYNGHYGVPCATELSCGAFEWLTIGCHIEIIPFFKHTYTIPMKTDYTQQGYINLASGDATVHLGTHWWISGFIKADHVIRGLSITTGYSNTGQSTSTIDPLNNGTIFFNPMTVNHDPAFRGWYMHTVHLMAEYDFTKEGAFFGPRLAIFSNIECGGKRTFNTTMTGINFGFELSWRY